MSKRENAATLYLYVKNHILKLLISGKYPPNSQLPTEYEFMKELDVGRATVRAALAQLEEEGTVYKRQGVGTFVSKKEKNFGLEPFMSFSFMLKHLGLEDTNKVVEAEETPVTTDELLKGWEKGTRVYKVKRIRLSENNPLAIEYCYFSSEVYKSLDKEKLSDSIAHNFLANLSTPIEKMVSTTIVREPTLEECKTLLIPVTEEVIQLTRWVYLIDSKVPASYVNFVIPSHVLEFPFLG